MITDWIIAPFNDAFEFSVTHRDGMFNLLGPWNHERYAMHEEPSPEMTGHLFSFFDQGDRREIIRATFPTALFSKNLVSLGDVDVALIRLAAY